jgi:hypothetical protein
VGGVSGQGRLRRVGRLDLPAWRWHRHHLPIGKGYDEEHDQAYAGNDHEQGEAFLKIIQ